MGSIWPGEQLVIRMWETLTERCIGSLLRPWQIRREGSATTDVRREELLALAQAESDVAAIREGRKQWVQGALVSKRFLGSPSSPSAISAGDSTELVAAAIHAQVKEAVRKETNVARAVLAAETLLKDDPASVPPDRIDEDWLGRWRENAASISTDDLQNMWGRVLAGEVKSPGTFSLRTLEFLRNLSQAEATLIAKAMSFTIDDIIVRNVPALDEDAGLDLSTLLRLQELGVISGVAGLPLKRTLRTRSKERFALPFLSNGKALLVESPDPSKELNLGMYVLTDLGRQLQKLGHFEPKVEYLTQVADVVKQQGFDVSLADVIDVTTGGVRYVNASRL